MKYSIILSTAREKDVLTYFPGRHHVDMTLESLEKQTFKDFEVVISDSIWSQRDLRDEVDRDRDWETRSTHPSL